jgi:hypothetical protein
MRVRIASIAFVSFALSCILPYAAQAQPFNCYCDDASKHCTYLSTVDASSVGASASPCIEACTAAGRDYCLSTDASSDPNKDKGAGVDAKGGVSGTGVPARDSQGATKDNQILSGSVLTLPLPLGNISLPALIGRVIKQILSIVGALALLFFVWGGLKWMLARGAADEIAKAKKIIVAALSGLIAIFASYAILDLIINTISK